MSEHEFEQFLTFFRSMLRLNPAQRDEIAAELSDHLQERLAELTARGMSREQAIQTALEDFGDAAGLAAQFLLVVTHHRRRRIMKWTASSVMAALVVLGAAIAFWPTDPPRGPALSPVVAQAPPAAAPPAATPGTAPRKASKGAARADSAGATQPSAAELLERRLADKLEAQFSEIALQDFLDFVTERNQIDFYLDQKALQDEGLASDAQISVSLKHLRLDRLLDLVLAQHDLAWVPREDYVLVTTQSRLENLLETRVYNCRDLLQLALFGGPHGNTIPGMGDEAGYGEEGEMGFPGGYGGGYGGGFGGGMAPGGTAGGGMAPGGLAPPGAMGGMPGAASDPGGMGGGMGVGMGMGPGTPGMASYHSAAAPYMTNLIEVVTTTVSPHSWTVAGGNGSVAAYHPGLLVVNHNPQAHRKIEQLLRMLREAAANRPGAVIRER